MGGWGGARKRKTPRRVITCRGPLTLMSIGAIAFAFEETGKLFAIGVFPIVSVECDDGQNRGTSSHLFEFCDGADTTGPV